MTEPTQQLLLDITPKQKADWLGGEKVSSPLFFLNELTTKLINN